MHIVFIKRHPNENNCFPFAFGSTLPIISLTRLYFVSGRLAITTQPIKWLQLNNIAKHTKLLWWLDTMDVGLCQTPIHVKPYISSLIKVQTTNRNTKHSLMLACILLRSTHNSWRVQWKQHDSVLIHLRNIQNTKSITRGLSAYIAPLLIEIMTTKAKEVVLN